MTNDHLPTTHTIAGKAVQNFAVPDTKCALICNTKYLNILVGLEVRAKVGGRTKPTNSRSNVQNTSCCRCTFHFRNDKFRQTISSVRTKFVSPTTLKIETSLYVYNSQRLLILMMRGNNPFVQSEYLVITPSLAVLCSYFCSHLKVSPNSAKNKIMAQEGRCARK